MKISSRVEETAKRIRTHGGVGGAIGTNGGGPDIAVTGTYRIVESVSVCQVSVEKRCSNIPRLQKPEAQKLSKIAELAEFSPLGSPWVGSSVR